MRKQIFTSVFVIIVLSLAGCFQKDNGTNSISPSQIIEKSTSQQEPNIVDTLTSTPQPSIAVSTPKPTTMLTKTTPQQEPGFIDTLTSTPQSSIAVSTPKPTTTLTKTAAIPDIPACAGISNLRSPKIGEMTGMILYQKNDAFLSYGLFLLDAAKLKEVKELIDGDREIYVFGLSPDGNWLAYSPVIRRTDGYSVLDQPDVTLLNSKGETLTNQYDMDPFSNELIPSDYRLDSFANSFWINNHLIYTVLSGLKSDGSPSYLMMIPKVFDPFTGTWELTTMKKMQELEAIKSLEFGLSPDTTRFAYRTAGDLELMDVEQEQLITTDKDLKWVDYLTIRWSPDSSKVAYTGFASPESRTLHIMTRDGEVQKISTPFLNVSSYNLKWSPNSRYIAALSYIEREKTIYIYDTLENKFNLMCPVPEEYNSMIWSPDSSVLAISGDGTPLLGIKLSSQDVLELHPNANIVGWSDQFR